MGRGALKSRTNELVKKAGSRWRREGRSWAGWRDVRLGLTGPTSETGNVGVGTDVDMFLKAGKVPVDDLKRFRGKEGRIKRDRKLMDVASEGRGGNRRAEIDRRCLGDLYFEFSPGAVLDGCGIEIEILLQK